MSQRALSEAGVTLGIFTPKLPSVPLVLAALPPKRAERKARRGASKSRGFIELGCRQARFATGYESYGRRSAAGCSGIKYAQSNLVTSPKVWQPWDYPSPHDGPDTVPPREGTLIDLDADPNEQTDVSKLNPDVVRRLSELADKAIGEANRHVVDNPKRPDTKYYPGPGRITEHNAVPIHEALDRTRGE